MPRKPKQPQRKWRNRIVGHDEVDPEQLLANPKNWRIHPKEQQAALEGVLSEVGWVQDVIVNQRTGFVVDGHARVAMAITAGERVPVVYVDLSEEEERLILATLDPLSAMAVTDKELLGDLLKDLEVTNDAVAAMLADLQGNPVKAGLTDPDDVPPVPEAPVTRLGDLWLLGEHRVLCGDATDAGCVARLLDGREPFLMVTDPPYGVSYDPTWRNRAKGLLYKSSAEEYIKGDDRADWSACWDHFPGGVAYVWTGALHAIESGEGLVSKGFEIRAEIIWCKDTFTIGRGGHYSFQHESCWYAVRKGSTAQWTGENNQSTFWKVPKLDDQPRTGHAAQKPVEIMRRPILNHSRVGEPIYEPFCGSGTTLIAAETTERQCLAMELDERFVDVIVQRWQNFTGKQATLDGHDGLTFEHVKHGRRQQAEDALKEEAVNASS